MLPEARRVAERILTLLAPVCTEIAIAGSVRRGKPEGIKDIEIVALPDWTVPRAAFGEPAYRNKLERHLDTLYRGGVLHPGDKDGPRYKTLVYQGVKVDLFLTDDDNWGNQLAIRTGDSDFSHALVTDENYGGLMPTMLKQKGGYLWRLSDYQGVRDARTPVGPQYGDEKIPCPDELAFFAALGFRAVPDPTVRDGAFARALARNRRAA
jgi:hypothetical protein